MKNQLRIITLLLALTIIPHGHAQTLREQLQQKKDELLGGGGSGASESEMPTEGQLEIAQKWESGEYAYFDVDGRYIRRDGTMYIRVLKNDDGTIKTVRLGEGSQYEMESQAYNPYSFGGSTFVCAFVKNNNNCIYFTDEMIVHYSCNKDYKVASIDWALNTKKKPIELMAEIQAYRDFGENKVDEDRLKLKEEEIAHRAEYTLEGKNVVSIKAVYPDGEPKAIGINESIDIGFEIELADGTVMKTSNIGGHAYIEDLIDEGMNGTIYGVGGTYMAGQHGANPKSNAYMKADISDITKDFIIITVKSKFEGTGSCTIKLAIDYPMESEANYPGSYGYHNTNYSGAGGDGGNGPDLIVKIKTTKHSETGETLYIIRVNKTGSSSGTLYKVPLGGSFFISSIGGAGGKGGPGKNRTENSGYSRPDDGGPGGDGGNGGNIVVYIDPAAKDIKVTGSVSGGSRGVGGVHGACYSCSFGSDGDHGAWGSNGYDGSFSKEIKAVNF